MRLLLIGSLIVGALNAQIPTMNRVQSVKMMTGECQTCGMDESSSELDLEICGYMGLLYVCCQTGVLDNPTVDDFRPGNISTFEQSEIGDCNGFDLTNNTDYATIVMDLSHKGSLKISNTYKSILVQFGVFIF